MISALETTNVLLTNVPVESVTAVTQAREESKSSAMFQLSAENLYSYDPIPSKVVKSQILSPSASDIEKQFPHHPLNVPFTSGVENGSVT